jgi:hypothetical protein
MLFRFRAIEVGVYDLKKEVLFLKASQYKADSFSSEDGELNHGHTIFVRYIAKKEN